MKKKKYNIYGSEIQELAAYALIDDKMRIPRDIERDGLMEIYFTKRAAKSAAEDSYKVIPISIIL